MSLFVRLEQIVITGQTTWIGMFDNGYCRSGETADNCKRGIDIQQVVKREFLTM